jgi:F-type H+-transporting ATPase subunit delta
MSKVSRRSLAKWAADQLTAGKSAAYVSKHLAAALVESGMTDQVDFLLNDVLWELEQNKVLVVGKITSARQITRQLEDSLAQQIKKATGVESVVIEKNVDKSVLGGVRVETSSHIWDSTVLRKLSELKEVF